MTLALVFSALFMGLAGSWHCAAMCGATSLGVVRACGGRSGGAAWAFQAGRLAGYAAAGAVVASGAAALAQLGAWSPAVRPLWVLAQAGALGLGLWLLWTGREPAWLSQLGRRPGGPPLPPGGWQRLSGPGKAALAGGLWAAWPCGLLHSALLLAALANGPAGGAAVMAAFAGASSVGLLGAGPVLSRLVSARSASAAGAGGPGLAAGDQAGRGAAAVRTAESASGPPRPASVAARVTPAALVRLAGLMLAAGAAWALGHGLWESLAAYCTPGAGAPL